MIQRVRIGREWTRRLCLVRMPKTIAMLLSERGFPVLLPPDVLQFVCRKHSGFYFLKRTCEIHVLSEVSIVATPAGKPGFFLHAWRPRLGCFMPGSRARSLPPDSLEQVYAKPAWVCFCNAWRPRLAFLYAGVQGPLPVLRLLVTRCIFQCFRVQSNPKKLRTAYLQHVYKQLLV